MRHVVNLHALRKTVMVAFYIKTSDHPANVKGDKTGIPRGVLRTSVDRHQVLIVKLPPISPPRNSNVVRLDAFLPASNTRKDRQDPYGHL